MSGYLNHEGYADPTFYEALRNIREEEKKNKVTFVRPHKKWRTRTWCKKKRK